MDIEINSQQRIVPRFPLPKEKIKFFFEEGDEKVFAVRDISLHGLGISFLEHGEALLFPAGYECRAELKVDGKPMQVDLRVVRNSAWGAGFTFERLSEELRKELQSFLDPIQIGHSLKPVGQRPAQEPLVEGISRWYHGDCGADLYFWHDARGGVEKALFCLGEEFWEWSEGGGLCTGTIEHLEGDQVRFFYHPAAQSRIKARVRKILEHAQVLDYRLVNFLQSQSV